MWKKKKKCTSSKYFVLVQKQIVPKVKLNYNIYMYISLYLKIFGECQRHHISCICFFRTNVLQWHFKRCDQKYDHGCCPGSTSLSMACGVQTVMGTVSITRYCNKVSFMLTLWLLVRLGFVLFHHKNRQWKLY